MTWQSENIESMTLARFERQVSDLAWAGRFKIADRQCAPATKLVQNKDIWTRALKERDVVGEVDGSRLQCTCDY